MRPALAVLALLSLSGCVATGKFKAQEAQARAEKSRADALETELADAKSKLQERSSELTAASAQIVSLKDSNKDLDKSLQANKGELSARISELVREKDALAQSLADERVETAAAKKRLDDALAEKKALEKAKQDELERTQRHYEDLAAGLKAEIQAGEIKLTELKGKLTVNMVDRILFDSGSAALKPEGARILDRVGKILAEVQDKLIRVEGHTDNVPIGGELKERFATNWELSTARATAVARYFQDKAKMEPKRLVAAGYAEHKPIASNDKPETRALNRRIEIVLIPKD